MKQFTKNPKIFFDFKDQSSQSLPPPPITKFREFLEAVLTKHNVFKCLTGVYRQKDGLPMGSSLSPLLANIFVAMFEESVVKKLQKKREKY